MIDLSKFSIDGISGSNIVLQPIKNTKSNKMNLKFDIRYNILNNDRKYYN